MHNNSTLTVKTLLGTVAETFALFAMLVQFALYADHIGAAAVAGIGAAGPGERLGVLEICTGSGVQRVSADGTPAVDGQNDCPICTNASILAFGEPVALDTPVFDIVPVEAVWVSLAVASLAQARFPGARPIRAPPVMATA